MASTGGGARVQADAEALWDAYVRYRAAKKAEAEHEYAQAASWRGDAEQAREEAAKADAKADDATERGALAEAESGIEYGAWRASRMRGGDGGAGGAGLGGASSSACLLCEQTDHYTRGCPLLLQGGGGGAGGGFSGGQQRGGTVGVGGAKGGGDGVGGAGGGGGGGFCFRCQQRGHWASNCPYGGGCGGGVGGDGGSGGGGSGSGGNSKRKWRSSTCGDDNEDGDDDGEGGEERSIAIFYSWWDEASIKALLDALKRYDDTKDPDEIATWEGVMASDETGFLRGRGLDSSFKRLKLLARRFRKRLEWLAKKSPAALARDETTKNLSPLQLATLQAFASRAATKGGDGKSFLK